MISFICVLRQVESINYHICVVPMHIFFLYFPFFFFLFFFFFFSWEESREERRTNLMCFVLGCTAYNLGTGCGTSVLEMVAAFEKASGQVKSLSLFLFLSA